MIWKTLCLISGVCGYQTPPREKKKEKKKKKGSKSKLKKSKNLFQNANSSLNRSIRPKKHSKLHLRILLLLNTKRILQMCSSIMKLGFPFGFDRILWELLVMMSRPFLLVFLLIILIITSQFEWRQQLVADLDSTPSINQKQHQISKREEAVKEKIILSQEKNIQRLNELVQSLQEQLSHCRGNNETRNSTVSHMSEHVIEVERQQILED